MLPEDALAEWIDTLEARVLRLQDRELPRGFALDYSPDSLDRLEAVVLDRLTDAAGVVLQEGFVLSVATYLGEALMRVGGGRWGWDGDLPLAHPDPALGLEAVSPVRVITEAVVLRRDGRCFATVYQAWAQAVAAAQSRDPGWSPQKQKTSLDRVSAKSRIAPWLSRQEAAFTGWVAQFAPGGSWDFTPESLPALEDVVRQVTPTSAALNDASHRDFRDVATWYLGEVMRRHLGGQWESDRDYEYVRQVGPYKGKCVPLFVLEAAVDGKGHVLEAYATFAE